jgi:imidazolonepropionase-like amidohydrolase
MYIRGKEALEIYEANNTHVGMSFPVNLPASAFKLATSKNDNGEFIVDAVSTDGGSHPRNVAIQSTMALVKFGALSRLDMAKKLSLTPARMLGLQDKGHFTEGADADITVLDPSINEPVMSFVAGEPIMINGQVVGSGGRLMVTPQGEAAARESGLPYQVLDLSQSKLYDGF